MVGARLLPDRRLCGSAVRGLARTARRRDRAAEPRGFLSAAVDRRMAAARAVVRRVHGARSVVPAGRDAAARDATRDLDRGDRPRPARGAAPPPRPAVFFRGSTLRTRAWRIIEFA